MNKRPIIKAIVFDYGGVLELSSSATSLFDDIADAINIPVERFRSEYYKFNHLSNVENLTQKELLPRVASLLGSDSSARDIILSIIDTHKLQKRINAGLVDLLPQIRQRGFRTAIFSNNTSKLRDRLIENGIIKLVDDVIISGEIGFQKPNKEAFAVLFETLGVLPHEVVFVDDTPKSLENADEIGYIPVLYKDNETLKHDLQSLGIILD